MPFALGTAEELGVPAIAYRTVSACAILAYLSVPKLIELGELPFPEGADLDEPIRGVPGMESFLRRRDLPVQCRFLTDTHQDPLLEKAVAATMQSRKARAFILNTTASLERASLTHLAREMRDVFAIGPLHAMSPAPAAATSLWRHDDRCLAWLDGQAERSVVYISLGSLTVISHEQFTEFLHGLVAAGYPFLWVLRPDMLGTSQDAALQEAVAAAGEGRSCVVPWVPQRDVLRHRAVGCFLTHAGWNSTVEGIVEGVPMVCWPFFVDQQINSRFVGAVWKNGLDMKDVCERDGVEGTVRVAMESAELRRTARALAEQVERDVADGGSSALEFKRLVSFIRELSSTSAAENDLQNKEWTDLKVAQTNLIHLPSSTLCYLHVKHHHLPPPSLQKGRKLRRRQRQQGRKRRKLFQCYMIVQQWVLEARPFRIKALPHILEVKESFHFRA
ncbi:hypothetical protein PVAP13_2KG422096 [Panicum virgatum]|uniref:Glycosyltransferase n=1 Tax=Panicum virgatum TaxID=38727 RepID=A0A8T0W7N2_PANVG|nr:hypothetical protein PVAP13_2KG422096 [Panicum virgatum]